MSDNLPLALTATIHRTSDLFRIAYRITNGGPAAAFVSVRTTLRNAASRRPYSVLRGPGKPLLLSMQLAPIPPNINIPYPFQPWFHRLPPGEEYADFAEIEVPVRELSPYCNPDYPADAPMVTVTESLFAMEYVLEPDIHFLKENRQAPGLFTTRGDPMVPLEISLPLDTPLPILKRTDNFFRW